MKTLPTLGFTEAIKLASGRILDFKGRSRRSEFWWWMAVVLVVGFCVSLFISNTLVSAIWGIAYMFCGLSVTARRLQDSGKSAIWVYISYAIGCIYSFYLLTTDVMEVMIKLQKASNNEHAVMRLLEKHMGDFAMLSLLGTLFLVFFLIVFIMCLLDSKPVVNKFGASPKYVEE
jgi:uncharacterized membrane protein YhaH (DUF805 family)